MEKIMETHNKDKVLSGLKNFKKWLHKSTKDAQQRKKLEIALKRILDELVVNGSLTYNDYEIIPSQTINDFENTLLPLLLFECAIEFDRDSSNIINQLEALKLIDIKRAIRKYNKILLARAKREQIKLV